MVGLLLMLVAFLAPIFLGYAALYMAISAVLSTFLPPDVSSPVAIAVLVLGTVIVFWRWVDASVLLGRRVVASLYRARALALEPTRHNWCHVTPARLAGVGSPSDRFDVSLIDREPESRIGGVRVSALAPIKGRNLYLVETPKKLECWVHDPLLSFRCALKFNLYNVENISFIEHDPDRLNLRDDHARRYVGTLDIACPGRRHLYFYVRVKPRYRA
jgi:hypothetical protein